GVLRAALRSGARAARRRDRSEQCVGDSHPTPSGCRSFLPRAGSSERVLMFWRRFASGRTDATDRHSRQWYEAVVFSFTFVPAHPAGLVWFAYGATREWRRGTDLLQERQASEALALAHAAIIRDMKGAWLDLIVPINDLDLDAEPPYDLMQHTAQTFAKFPY